MVARPPPRAAAYGGRRWCAASTRPARPAVGPAARAAIPARQPLAIEAPAPLHAWIGMPAGSGGLALARLAAQRPGDTGGSLSPELLLAADIEQALAAPAEDVVTTR